LESASPSWTEIINFARFLNCQLIDSEKSVYCNFEITGDLLPGFKTFVVKCMIQMSHDFALPSLKISDQSALKLNGSNQAVFDITKLKMRRMWESEPHPYLLFNPDGHTFTFFGFCVNKSNGYLIDPNTNTILFDHRISLSRQLINGIDNYNRLHKENILQENVALLTKEEKIKKLLCFM